MRNGGKAYLAGTLANLAQRKARKKKAQPKMPMMSEMPYKASRAGIKKDRE